MLVRGAIWFGHAKTGAHLAAISDTDRTEKTKGLAGNHRLTPAIFGSPTWARTRDLRINRRIQPLSLSGCGRAHEGRLESSRSSGSPKERSLATFWLRSLLAG